MREESMRPLKRARNVEQYRRIKSVFCDSHLSNADELEAAPCRVSQFLDMDTCVIPLPRGQALVRFQQEGTTQRRYIRAASGTRNRLGLQLRQLMLRRAIEGQGRGAVRVLHKASYHPS